jgi:hypothetical protein
MTELTQALITDSHKFRCHNTAQCLFPHLDFIALRIRTVGIFQSWHVQNPYEVAAGNVQQLDLLQEELGLNPDGSTEQGTYSTVTDFARLRGLSTSVPRAQAV